MNIETLLTNSLEKSKKVINDSLNSREFIESLRKASELIIDTYNKNGKVLLAGNGGSAADSQHVCAEFVGRFNFDRPSLPAIALTTNTSNLTCIANDYGYDEIFTRQMHALAKSNDTLIVYTTSGKSSNIIKLIHEAKGKVSNIIALTGEYTDDLDQYCDVVVSVKSPKTTRIQEIHAIAGHIMCECVEETLFNN